MIDLRRNPHTNRTRADWRRRAGIPTPSRAEIVRPGRRDQEKASTRGSPGRTLSSVEGVSLMLRDLHGGAVDGRLVITTCLPVAMVNVLSPIVRN